MTENLTSVSLVNRVRNSHYHPNMITFQAVDTITTYSFCTDCKPEACIDGTQRYIDPDNGRILHTHEGRVQISICHGHIHGSLGAPGSF